MSDSHIKTVDDLKQYLHLAMQLEHATIPVYLTALYSIVPGTNTDASRILRVVAVEEMLHLTLAANLLNSIGGQPDLTAKGFVPRFPTPLPDGETDFKVSLMKFSREAVETFCKIERPAIAQAGQPRHRTRTTPGDRLAPVPHDDSLSFYSIGEFYAEIRRGFVSLHEQLGAAMFCGDPSFQVTGKYYYSGGGKLSPVSGLESATAAIDLIAGQGEGYGGHIFDEDGEIAHYYRFDQLRHGRYYQQGDAHGVPTGPSFVVDWSAVYPLKTDTCLLDLQGSKELYDAAVVFNDQYAVFLRQLTDAFNGNPAVLIKAVHTMFHLRDGMLQLMHNPLPGADGLNAAPTFEIGGAAC
jgi:rubrerythrin